MVRRRRAYPELRGREAVEPMEAMQWELEPMQDARRPEPEWTARLSDPRGLVNGFIPTGFHTLLTVLFCTNTDCENDDS